MTGRFGLIEQVYGGGPVDISPQHAAQDRLPAVEVGLIRRLSVKR